jgi:hypothetical protein
MIHFRQKFILVLTILCVCATSWGQEGFPYPGVDDSRSDHVFISNANIHISFDKKIENGFIIIKNGRIDAIGTDLEKPETASEYDAKV